MAMSVRFARGIGTRRIFQRTVYRPGELVQSDLWEPQGADPGRPRTAASWLGRGRRVFLVAAIAGALVLPRSFRTSSSGWRGI